jgi:hypothetical protein
MCFTLQFLIFERKHFCLFKIATQGVSLWHFHVLYPELVHPLHFSFLPYSDFNSFKYSMLSCVYVWPLELPGVNLLCMVWDKAVPSPFWEMKAQLPHCHVSIALIISCHLYWVFPRISTVPDDQFAFVASDTTLIFFCTFRGRFHTSSNTIVRLSFYLLNTS